MQRTIYDAIGGADRLLTLATAWHSRCLDDEIVRHAFSHPGQHPDHLERLAAYWGEALGGPPAYSSALANQLHVVVLHSGNGVHTEMDDRAIACFAGALADIGVTTEPLRSALLSYFEWSTRALAGHPDGAAHTALEVALPHWSWAGRIN